MMILICPRTGRDCQLTGCTAAGRMCDHWPQQVTHDLGYAAGFKAGMRRAAEICDMNRGEILLLAGELNAGELRSVKAVLDSRVRAILAEAEK